MGGLCRWQGDLDGARDLLAPASEAARTLTFPVLTGLASRWLILTLVDEGDWQAVEQMAHALLARGDEAGDTHTAATAHHSLGVMARELGDVVRAERSGETALALATEGRVRPAERVTMVLSLAGRARCVAVIRPRPPAGCSRPPPSCPRIRGSTGGCRRCSVSRRGASRWPKATPRGRSPRRLEPARASATPTPATSERVRRCSKARPPRPQGVRMQQRSSSPHWRWRVRSTTPRCSPMPARGRAALSRRSTRRATRSPRARSRASKKSYRRSGRTSSRRARRVIALGELDELTRPLTSLRTTTDGEGVRT